MDRETKGRLYARAGIEVYWIVDIQQRRVIVLKGPGDEYKSVTIYETHEKVPLNEIFSLSIDTLFTQD